LPIVFGLWCTGPTEGYRLYMFHGGCGRYDDGINVRTHIAPPRKVVGGGSVVIPNDEACTVSWTGQYNQIVGGSISGIPAEDCNPFVFGPISQSFPDTYPQHPLRGIYGATATWIITEP
jgi:hypothetical protein